MSKANKFYSTILIPDLKSLDQMLLKSNEWNDWEECRLILKTRQLKVRVHSVQAFSYVAIFS